MCSISTNKTAREGFEQLAHSGQNSNQELERRLFKFAQEASPQQTGLFEKPECLLRHMEERHKSVKHYRLGRHRAYFTGSNARCSYDVVLLKIFKKDDVDREGSAEFDRKLDRALADSPDQLLSFDPVPDEEVG